MTELTHEQIDDDDNRCHSLECTCEECIQNHPERVIYMDDDEYQSHLGDT